MEFGLSSKSVKEPLFVTKISKQVARVMCTKMLKSSQYFIFVAVRANDKNLKLIVITEQAANIVDPDSKRTFDT